MIQITIAKSADLYPAPSVLPPIVPCYSVTILERFPRRTRGVDMIGLEGEEYPFETVAMIPPYTIGYCKKLRLIRCTRLAFGQCARQQYRLIAFLSLTRLAMREKALRLAAPQGIGNTIEQHIVIGEDDHAVVGRQRAFGEIGQQPGHRVAAKLIKVDPHRLCLFLLEIVGDQLVEQTHTIAGCALLP